MSRILVIDDEKSIQRSLRIALHAAGFEVFQALDGSQALSRFAQCDPEIVLLDLGLPDMPGLEVLQRLREISRVPILILSVRDAERQKVEALDAGANDYVTKPFGVQELLARLRAALRNSPERPAAPARVRLGHLVIDHQTQQVFKQGQPVKLTRTEARLLQLLLRHAGRVLTHRQMLEAIWGDACRQETHYLQVYVSQLRRKLEADPLQPSLILTEPGVGYRLAADL